MIHAGTQTPWGKAQEVEYVTPWLTFVSTAGHGGYKVDRSHNGVIPEYLRKKGGWYEEDCDWSIVFSVLEDLIKKDCFDFACEYNKKLFDSKIHLETFRNWYPIEYEMFFNVILKEGESYKKDENTWLEKNKGKWHVVSAITLFDGWCKLTLCLDGNREHIRTPLERELIVKDSEYELGKLRETFGTALTGSQIRYYENIAQTERKSA